MFSWGINIQRAITRINEESNDMSFIMYYSVDFLYFYSILVFIKVQKKFSTLYWFFLIPWLLEFYLIQYFMHDFLTIIWWKRNKSFQFTKTGISLKSSLIPNYSFRWLKKWKKWQRRAQINIVPSQMSAVELRLCVFMIYVLTEFAIRFIQSWYYFCWTSCDGALLLILTFLYSKH